MFRQENAGLTVAPDVPSQPNSPVSGGKKRGKKLYALVVAVIAIVVIAGTLLIPQGSGSQIQLSLTYTVGDHMTYDITNTVTGQQYTSSVSIPGSYSDNLTLSIAVLGFDGQYYKLNQTTETATLGSLSLILNVNKTSYYNDFIAPGAPDVFYNISSNPALAAYLAKPTVNVGDVWQFPVSTGNASLGYTGEMTLKFAGIQNLTVPAGTYKTFSVEVSTGNLILHADPDYLNAIHLDIPDNMTLQMNGTAYLEQGTCRLIKSDLTQESAFQTNGIAGTSSMYTEKILVRDTKP